MNELTALFDSNAARNGADEATQRIIGGDMADTMSLSARQIWQTVNRHRLLLGIIVGTAVLVALLSQLLATPIYRSTALVQVELNQSSDAREDEVAARNQQRVVNETRTYRSRSLASKVVRDLKLLDDPRFEGAAAKKAPDTEVDDGSDPLSQATTKLMGMMDISSQTGSDFIEITARTPSRDLSADIANQYVKSLRERRLKQRAGRKQELASELDVEVRRLDALAQDADRRLAAFRSSHNMPVGAGSTEDYSQFNRIEVEAASANGLRAASAAQAAGDSRAATLRTTAGATSALLQQQERQRAELQSKRSSLSVLFGAGHPDVQQVDAELAVLDSSIATEQARVQADERAKIASETSRQQALAQSAAAAAAARAGQLSGQLAALKNRMFANVSNAPDLAQLEREADIAHEAFNATAQRAQSVKAGLDSGGINSWLVSAAVPSDVPVWPQPKRTVVAAFAGSLMLGLLIIYMAELLDNKLRSAEQMRRMFRLPTFAMFPHIAGSLALSPEESPVTRDPQSLFAEVARSLHAEVEQLPHEGKKQSVLITSPLPGDGKSTVALSLVAAAAAMGRRAVLVDLDLRRPGVLQEIQRGFDGPDLVDYLTGAADMRKLLPNAAISADRETDRFKLVLISTRAPVRDPAALIRAGRLQKLTGELFEQFDLVVINAPATLAVRDVRTLTDIADSTLIVLNWGKTTVEQMRASHQLLQGQIDGAVFNQVDYAEHARRGYGDAVQFYVDSSSYYHGPVPTRRTFADWLRSKFGTAPESDE